MNDLQIVVSDEGIVMMPFEANVRLGRAIISKTIDELAEIYKDWKEARDRYVVACERFDGSVECFDVFLEAAIRYNAYMGIAFLLYVAAESKLNAALKEGEFTVWRGYP